MKLIKMAKNKDITNVYLYQEEKPINGYLYQDGIPTPDSPKQIYELCEFDGKLFYKEPENSINFQRVNYINEKITPQEKIEKAIKWIESNSYEYNDYRFGNAIKSYAFDRNANPIELLKILKGSDK